MGIKQWFLADPGSHFQSRNNSLNSKKSMTKGLSQGNPANALRQGDKSRHVKENILSLWVYLALIFLTWIVFSPVIQHGFIMNDDPDHVFENVQIRSLSFENIRNIFTTTIFRTYVPLTILSFAVEYHFFGLNPHGYHFDNLILHIAVVLLIYRFAGKYLNLSPWASFLGALLFAVHPMHVESVAWVTERKDVLYSFFYLLALERYACYIKKSDIRNYLWLMCFSLLSILSKPMALSLPFILCLLDWYWKRKPNIFLTFEKIPIAMAVWAIGWVTYSLNARVSGQGLNESLLTWMWSAAFYPQHFIWPDPLLPVYSLPKPIIVSNWLFLKAILVLGLIVLLLWIFKRYRLGIFAALYFFCSAFFLFRFDDKVDVNFVADRFMYLPSLGICLLAGALFVQIANKALLRKRELFLITCLLISTIYGFWMVKSYRQAAIWGDEVKLWSGVIKSFPEVFAAYDHRGYAYGIKGDFQLAINDYNQALRINPQYVTAYNNRGIAYTELGLYDLALADFNRAIILDTGKLNSYLNRGNLFARWGQAESALLDYERVLVLDRHYSLAYANRGIVYMEQGKYLQAIEELTKALKYNPFSIECLNNRAIAYARQGENFLAMQDLNQSLKLKPNDPESYFNRGVLFLKNKEYSKAREDFDTVLKLKPQHVQAQKAIAQLEANLHK